MARGVQENEVFAAADTLLGAGERPTVERVRQALGRGSPNTIGPLLDTWWAQLAERLQHRLTLPAVPEAVGTALAQIWELALAAGRQQAEATLVPERQKLTDAQAALAAQLAAAGDQVRQAQTQAQQATAATQSAEAALAISTQRADDLASQVGHLQRQNEELQQRYRAQETQLQAALERVEQERTAAAGEREVLQAHLRQAEDRGFAEIDRLRQEVKATKAHLSTQAREHIRAIQAAGLAQRTAEKAQHAAERESAAARARLDALQATSGSRRTTVKKAATPRQRKPASRTT